MSLLHSSIILAIFMAPAVAFLTYVGVMYFTGNMWVYFDGKFIRSAQLSEKKFVRVMAKYQPKVVISLRKSEVVENEFERRWCESFGISYFNIPLGSNTVPSDKQLQILNSLFGIYRDHGIYVHCLGGADRTSLASAIYHLSQQGKSVEEAEKQISFWFGHMAWKKPNMRKALGYFASKNWN
jgi:protein-tyrosine phosphatase